MEHGFAWMAFVPGLEPHTATALLVMGLLVVFALRTRAQLAAHNFADGMPSNNSATATTSVTGAATGSHIGDLDGSSVNNGNTWTASVAVAAHGSTHEGLANATVTGSWSDGGTSSCTTNGAGQCSISKSGTAKKIGSLTFTVTSVTSSGLGYSASANHDADSDSDGTAIIVSKP
jgi:hypothetical protein